MVGRVVNFHLRGVLQLFVVRSGEREVRRVIEHIAFLGVDVDLEVRHGERSGLMHSVGHLLDRVPFFLGVVRLECLFEFDIRVERVVVGAGGLVAIGYIQRHLDLRLLGEESSCFECRTDAQLVEVIHVTVQHVGFDGTVSGSLQATGYVHLGNVTDGQRSVGHGCHTALLVELAEA